ncbi:hypothetical protein J7F01_40345 [Streptomyces sp. ISL-22]|uniref:hypothetical protein n=1 Tax=unclassified Streptomyces TaxID=2593676 RepID=UPI001BE74CD6|nr:MULTISPECIES: hypothetical protein [unclassified Streptomyces]MBT2420577.1 hypothetical protein [Streptomyces sp. ISL-24]MBT2438266.1 hypothetical protein [Streptomyces sp. ISL-22]
MDLPSDEAQQRQADRLAVLQPPRVTGPALFDAALALVTGMLTERAREGVLVLDDPLDGALDGVLADLQHADPLEVATTYANLVISMLEPLTLATGASAAELWRHCALTAARRNEGDDHD